MGDTDRQLVDGGLKVRLQTAPILLRGVPLSDRRGARQFLLLGGVMVRHCGVIAELPLRIEASEGIGGIRYLLSANRRIR